MIYPTEGAMEYQEIERTIQFILNQQAQFASDIQQLREIQSEQQGQISKLNDALITVTGVIGQIAKMQEELAAEFARQKAEFDRRQTKLEERHAQLEERHAELEERFNAFVLFMEKYLSDKGNGHKSKA